jgi:hypothetical protein
MSYIRSLSNPEKLYIWSDGVNVHIAEGVKENKIMPRSIFHGLVRKWLRNRWEDCTFKDASVKEVWLNKGNKSELRIELSYDGWKVYMWPVTWVYITHTNLSTINYGVKRKIVIE